MALATESNVNVELQYRKEWLQEDRILCYRFFAMNNVTIDHWFKDLQAEFGEWPLERPWRLLLDIRLGGGLINTYSLRRSREIARMRPELTGRLAVLVASKLSHDIIAMAIRATSNAYRKRAVFMHEAQAIQWLLETESRLPRR